VSQRNNRDFTNFLFLLGLVWCGYFTSSTSLAYISSIAPPHASLGIHIDGTAAALYIFIIRVVTFQRFFALLFSISEWIWRGL
jgi:hypothetical protein